jgi:putative spermidine/putrescine transport system substrate-binding protein
MESMMPRLALTAALAGLALAAQPVAAQQPELVVSTFGIAQEAFRRILFQPFEAECGCKVVVESGNNADRLAKLEARRDNPNIDMAVFLDFTALEAHNKGLVERLDPARLSNFGKLHDFAKDPLGNGMAVGYTAFSTSIVYRTDKLKDVTSWKDLWRPELKGRVAIPNITTSQAPNVIMMADRSFGGMSEGFAGGIDKLADLKPNIVTFYERGAQVVTLFAQDEIWAAPVGRFNWGNLKRTGLPLAWLRPAEGEAGGVNVMVMIKGSKKADLVYRLMDKWLSAPVQKALADALVDSPVNREVKLSPEIAEVSTYGDEDLAKLKLIPPAQASRRLGYRLECPCGALTVRPGVSGQALDRLSARGAGAGHHAHRAGAASRHPAVSGLCGTIGSHLLTVRDLFCR